MIGNLTNRHKEIFQKNPLFVGMKLPEVKEVEPFEKRFHRVSAAAMDILKVRKATTVFYISKKTFPARYYENFFAKV